MNPSAPVQDGLRGLLETVRRTTDEQPVHDDELLEALVVIRELREALADWEPALIAAARGAGVSWNRLAPALGVTSRQAAERRYLRMRPGNDSLTREQRIRATRDERAGDRAVAAWARDNASDLRRLADLVTSVSGLDAAGRRGVRALRDQLADGEPADLLAPLEEMHLHLTAQPGLARRVGAVGRDVNRVRKRTQEQRDATPG